MEGFNSAKRASLLDVMSALSQVIESQRALGQIGDPTPTELFAGKSLTKDISILFELFLMHVFVICILAVISLTLSSGAAVDHLPKVLKIFSFVTPQTAVSVLRGQFRPTAVTLMRIIQGCPDEVQIQGFALNALGSLLCAQEPSEGFWSSGLIYKSIMQP